MSVAERMKSLLLSPRRLAGVVAFLAFAALMVVAQMHHEPWRDEIHCWNVGRSAYDLWDILTGERRYDGHPFLWYWLLHLVSKISRDPVAMQVFTVACTALTAWLVLFRSPFATYERVLLLFSHYFVYEYAVVCRSYVVGVLLVCLFCAVYDPRRVRHVTLAVILVAIAAISAYNALVAASLALFLFGHHVAVEKHEHRPTFWALAVPRAMMIGLVVFFVGVVFVGFTTAPPGDAHFDNPWEGSTDLVALFMAFRRFFIGMVPIPPLGAEHVWNHSFHEVLKPSQAEWITWAGLALLVAWVIALARRPFLALPFLVGVVLMAAFQNFKYEGAIRHWGHFWLLLVACVWLSRKAGTPKRGWRFERALFALNLLAQVYSGYVVLNADLEGTFSSARATAAYIRDAGLANEVLVGAHDHPVSAVAGYLDRDFIWPETGEKGQLVVFHNRRADATVYDLLRTAWEQSIELGVEPVIVSNFPIKFESYRGKNLVLLYEAPETIVEDERFRVYRMEQGIVLGR